ncbi:hypothetical protein SDC9_106452 [bioreactor metagenome]|uniref:Uncharacterized protein n=1 Tax=bioreactor metagenome TaxID=1076179 RepID=A0A645B2H9_9ZZZZ
MVDDGVNCNSSFTGTTVADDQLTLSTADWHQSIDSFNTGLQRNIYRFTVSNTRSLSFDTTYSFMLDFAFAINWITKSVNYTAKHFLADRNLHDTTGTTYHVTLLNSSFAAH